MAVSLDVLSSTLHSIRDSEVDSLFTKVAVLDGARKHGGVITEDGGTKLVRPLSLDDHSTPTQLASGYEAIAVPGLGAAPGAEPTVLRSAEYDWCDFAAPISISRKEELENQGEKAIVKIVEARMRSVMGMLRREMNQQILVGNSAVLTNLNTLNGSGAGITTGFLHAESVTTQQGLADTVGGIAKNSTTAPGWANQAVDIGAAFGTDGIRLMQEAYIRGNSVAPMGDISLAVLSEAAMANYRRALFANERYVNEKVLDGGRMSLAFAGASVEQDTQLGFSVNSADYGVGPVSGYLLNFDGIKLAFHKDADFAVSDFEDVPGYAVKAAQLYVKCQLIADHLGSQAVLFDGDTW